jgi:hypothetical protein
LEVFKIQTQTVVEGLFVDEVESKLEGMFLTYNLTIA